MRHVIVGNGPAGVVAAETLRAHDRAAEVVLIGDEAGPPYSRMAIPYMLAGQIDEAGTHLRKDAAHFSRLGVELKHARVAGVDTAGRSVRFEGGGALAYDRLLIASGSRPLRPPIPGMDLPGVHPCWTLADAHAILARARKGARVVQVGAGFIGCIIMEALAARGVALTVIEMGNRMVPRMMTQTAGDMMRGWCEGQGVRVLVSSTVASIDQAGGALSVRLEGGEKLPADLVIVAAGVKPAVEFLAGSGIAVDTGVLVDETMRSSAPEVYAAGDVSQSPDMLTGERVVNAIQPHAVDQARVAALNMAGRETRSRGTLAMNVLDTLGLVASSYGQWMGVKGGQDVELADRERFRYVKLAFDGDVLVGANSLGLTEHVGVLRGLIQTRTRLGKWKDLLLEDPTRIMEAYLARAQAAA